MSQQMPYAPAPPMPPQQPKNGLGTTALILGIVGVVLAFFYVGGLLGLLALIFGIIGLGKVKKGEANNKGVALTGVILGVVSMLIAIAMTVFAFILVDKAVEELDKLEKDAAASAPKDTGTDAAAGDAAGGDAPAGETFALNDVAEWEGGVQATVTKIEKFEPSDTSAGHTAGNDAYKVTVVLENTTKENYDQTGLMVEASAGENGTPAESVFDEGLDLYDGTTAPGKKATLVYGFSVEKGAKTLDVSVTPDFMSEPVVWQLQTS
jgi:phosphate/sulfate permease